MDEFMLSMDHQLAAEMDPRYLPKETEGIELVYLASFKLCVTLNISKHAEAAICNSTSVPIMKVEYLFDAAEDGYQEYDLEPIDRLSQSLLYMFDKKTI